MSNKFFQALIILSVVVVGSVVLIVPNYSLADWTPPPADPPGGWTLGAPIYSTGLANQTISGVLQVQSNGAYDLIINSLKSGAGDYISLTGGLVVNTGDPGVSALDVTGNVGVGVNLGYLVGINNAGNGKALYVSSNGGTAIQAESTDKAIYGKVLGDSASAAAVYGETQASGWAGYFLGTTGVQGMLGVNNDGNTGFFGGMQDGDFAADRLCFINDDSETVDCKSSWAGVGGGGGTPGGANTQVQFNNNGAFGGDSGLTYNSSTDALILVGNLTASGVTLSGTTLSGTDASNFYINGNGDAQIRIDSDNNGANIFKINNGANSTVFQLDETGNVTTTGRLIVGSTVSTTGIKITDGNQAAGRVLTSAADGTASWQVAAGGGGTPGGANTQVQFNNNGSFGGDPGLTYSSSTDSLTVQGMTMFGSNALNLASNENLLYGNIDSASQGNLIKLQNEGVNQFVISANGTTSLNGNIYFYDANGGYKEVAVQTEDSSFNGTGLKVYAGSARSCFAAETKITTPNGVIAIKDLKVGDKVVSYDPDNNKYITTKVKNVFIRQVDEYYILNNNIKVTAEHPFYTKTGWKVVRELTNKDELFGFDGVWQSVKSKVLVKQPLTVYNLHVDQPNTYFAEGVLVHNKAPGNGGDLYLFGGRSSGYIPGNYQQGAYVNDSDGRMGNVILGHDGNNFYGKVGVGNNDPQYGFDVATSSHFTTGMIIGNVGQSIPNALNAYGSTYFTTVSTTYISLNGEIKITGGNPGAGKVLTSDADGDASWQSGGAGNPAGDIYQLQFNNNGSFGADPRLIYNYSTGALTNNGSLTVGSLTATGTVALPTGAITSAMIADSTVTTNDIANSTITATDIANSTITGSKIAAGTIDGSNISSATSLTVGSSYVGGMTQLGNSTPALIAGQNLLYGNISSISSGGNLILLQNNFVDKFFVDKDGNATISGNATVGGNLDFGYELITNDCGSVSTCQASCTTGKKILSGGCNTSGSVSLRESYPEATKTTWTCGASNINTMSAYAICARITTGGT